MIFAFISWQQLFKNFILYSVGWDYQETEASCAVARSVSSVLRLAFKPHVSSPRVLKELLMSSDWMYFGRAGANDFERDDSTQHSWTQVPCGYYSLKTDY